MNETTHWVGPVLGILAVVALIVGAGITGQIDAEPSDSTSAILQEYRDSAGDIRLGAFIGAIGLGLLLLYLAHLRTRLADAGAGWAAAAVITGGTTFVVAMFILSAVQLAGSEAGDNNHTEVAVGVVDFIWNSAWIFSPGLLAFGVGAAVASFVYNALPRWLGAFGVLVALSCLAPWFGVPILGVWVIAACLHELLTSGRGPFGREGAPGSRPVGTS